MGKYLPDDIIDAMKKKYGMKTGEIEKLYVAYWKMANYHARANKPNKVENIEDGDIPIPHIGKLLLKKKIVEYVKQHSKVQKH